MILGLYRFLTTIGGWPILRLLEKRKAQGKEDAERFTERLGQPGVKRPEGPLVWLHGASVGEAISLLVLVERLRHDYPALNLLVTTGTVTSARLLGNRLPPGVIHQYVPVDRPAYAEQFIAHWRPDLVLWAESEFWPNLINGIGRRTIPLILINGRISDRSFRRWRLFSGAIGALLSRFVLCLGQTDEDARRLKELGAGDARTAGNLKFAAPPLPAEEGELATLRSILGERPLWLAASTHSGEEAIAGRVHRAVAATQPGVLTVIVPRHPDRAETIAEALRRQDLKVARRSLGETPDETTDIYLADTMGEMGLFFRLAPVVFMGKSLPAEDAPDSAKGGQNPLEPARLDCAILFGPEMTNFRYIADRLTDANAALMVKDEATLACGVAALLSDESRRKAMAEAASGVVDSEAAALDRIMAEIAPHLETAAEKAKDDAGA
ncbi:MAG: 3-deoxy-D-manno-octulosonic acid transferase [Rhodospirillales bacterium]|nr:3-deoxy-D-manno-octulosonic acid transferase [Rhodospirillales bacterium]